MGFLAFSLLLPETRQAHGRPQFQRLRLLAAGDIEGLLEAGFCLRCRAWQLRQQ